MIGLEWLSGQDPSFMISVKAPDVRWRHKCSSVMSSTLCSDNRIYNSCIITLGDECGTMVLRFTMP